MAKTQKVDGPVGWVRTVTPPHQCIRPVIGDSTGIGSLWRCGDCGKFWVVDTSLDYNGVAWKYLREATDEDVRE